MKSPKMLIQIIDNDPKGERSGTLYKVSFDTLSLGQCEIIYSILDEVHNTEQYKQYCHLYALFQQDKEAYVAYQNEQQKILSDLSKQSRLASSTLDVKVIEKIPEILLTLQDLIDGYVSKPEKVLNSLVGRTLRSLSILGLHPEPMILKEHLKQILEK